MSFNYRFSVIPAGAIIDARLTPRALQVLCLLGRHTNDQGWCSRSQVKMARELDCARSTVYDALDILLQAGWIERKANGRGGRTPESADHPFSAYSYRVVLDREALPSRVANTDSGHDDCKDHIPEGAAPAAGGAGIAAGGADMAAPLEGISPEGISSEPERDARAREVDRGKLAKLKAKWPTTALDDQDQIERAWQALADPQQAAALDRADDYLDYLKRMKRSAVPSLAKYLRQALFEHLPAKAAAPPPQAVAFLEVGTDAFRAYALACRIAGKEPTIQRKGGKDGVIIAGAVPTGAAAIAALDAVPIEQWLFLHARDHRTGADARWAAEIDRDRQQLAAWRETVRQWIGFVPKGEMIKRLDEGPYLEKWVKGVLVPAPWPPPKTEEKAA